MGIRISKQKPGVPIDTFATYQPGDPVPALRFETTDKEQKKTLADYRGQTVLVYFYNLGDTDLPNRLAAKYTVLALSDEKRYAILKDLVDKPKNFVSGRVMQSDVRSQFPWLRQGPRPRAVLINPEGQIVELLTTRDAIERLIAPPKP